MHRKDGGLVLKYCLLLYVTGIKLTKFQNSALKSSRIFQDMTA